MAERFTSAADLPQATPALVQALRSPVWPDEASWALFVSSTTSSASAPYPLPHVLAAQSATQPDAGPLEVSVALDRAGVDWFAPYDSSIWQDGIALSCPLDSAAFGSSDFFGARLKNATQTSGPIDKTLVELSNKMNAWMAQPQLVPWMRASLNANRPLLDAHLAKRHVTGLLEQLATPKGPAP